MRVSPKRIRPTIPDNKVLSQGTKLVSRIEAGSRKREGTVCDEHDNVLWRYELRNNNSPCSTANPFRKRDFVLADSEGRDTLTIRRISFVPPVFQMIAGEGELGRIRMSSVFRNRYSVWIDGEHPWTFHMPLFTIAFFGQSESETEIWAMVGPSERQWSILLKPKLEAWPLAAVLAFIHHERYFYS